MKISSLGSFHVERNAFFVAVQHCEAVALVVDLWARSVREPSPFGKVLDLEGFGAMSPSIVQQ
jgi:hypothetical protein